MGRNGEGIWSRYPTFILLPGTKVQPKLNKRQGSASLNRNSTSSRAKSPKLSRSGKSYRQLRSLPTVRAKPPCLSSNWKSVEIGKLGGQRSWLQ